MTETALAAEAATRVRILRETARLLAERGYAATSMREIAAAAGVKAGSLYHYFASKEELTLEVLAFGIGKVTRMVEDALSALPADATHRARLEAAARGHLDALLSGDDFTSAHVRCFSMVPDVVRRPLADVRNAHEALFQRILEDAAAAGALAPERDLALLRRAILGALNWSLEWRRQADSARGEFAALLADLAFR